MRLQGVRVSTCRFSDDGKLVAAGTEDGNLQLWAIGASGMANHNWSLKATVVSAGHLCFCSILPQGSGGWGGG